MTPTWGLVAALLGVGVLSTALPYSFEAVALRRLPAETFSLLTALLPATSMLVGLIVLHQVPSWAELSGLLAISVAVWMGARSD